ncbi:hypothetical protein EI94DRAFT_1572248, partial [Lactarius quietus]
PEDPSLPIKGMYRLLDLTTEQGNNGIVQKIVIAQESLQAFINALSPGAYSSIAKVNFKKLDDLLLKPIGVYGSKEEIVKFFSEMGALTLNDRALELLIPKRDYAARGAGPILRSGLYIIRTFTSTAEEQTYVLYWPEDTTWDDNAVRTVQSNRVTFMRYLTKICDQLVCLLSAKHSQAIVLENYEDSDPDDSELDSVIDDTDRLFCFTPVEREDNVIAREGFSVRCLLSPIKIDPISLSPRLLHGETGQAFMTVDFRVAKATFQPAFRLLPSDFTLRGLHFREQDVVLCLSESLDDKALETLTCIGLSIQFSKEHESWVERKIEIENRFEKTLTKPSAKIRAAAIQEMVREAVIGEILKAFPAMASLPVQLPSHTWLVSQSVPIESHSYTSIDALQSLFATYPKAELVFRHSLRAAHIDKGINGTDFQSKRERMLILLSLLTHYKDLTIHQIRSLCNAVLVFCDEQKTLGVLKSFAVEGNKMVTLSEEAMCGDARSYAASISDLRFLSYVKSIPTSSFLHDAALECEETAYDCLTMQLDSLVHGISVQILSIQRAECDKQAQLKVKNEEERGRELKDSRAKFVRKIEDLCRERSRSYAAYASWIKLQPTNIAQAFILIRGRKEIWPNQEIEYTVHKLRWPTDQRHNLLLDPSYVPIPVLDERLDQSFHISTETVVKYAHLLECDRILLCLVDSDGNVMIILGHLSDIDHAIQSRSYAKFFHWDKIGETCLFALDESMRLFAVYASAKMELHMFQFDEEFKSLRGSGTKVDLLPFYDAGVSITHACFVHGTEAILFIDSSAQARIFSLILLQPKPASLQLPQIPCAVYSAPDGSCVLVVQDLDGKRTITAYHWSTFGSTCGIFVPLPDFPVNLDAALITSIVNRNNVHVVGLSLDTQSCRSVALDITRKATEFSFQERRSKRSSSHGKQTVHNCLIDCHKDVWTRFPVVAAVKRQTITSSSQRQQKTLLFVTDDYRRPFSSHFSNMISAFEKTSRKPTGDELKSITVSTRAFPSFTQEFLSSPNWPVSRFRVGEWLADLLCLIPIHIAITHENRFVPLKDGAVSPQMEESLLGAATNWIINSLSLGWYESIFLSHWASKPVKVVSSMGEVSVGKSFTLNHLVDTSFAGSATRTTEGVWMSVTPTEDALIVALDFEGVNSLERSVQEDALLALFNTAISNLVLFRNNFALSRDISGLFQSFQSSSSVLDPASNPSLFQSTLVVIIKDVIDSDKAEVTKEFSLKFQKIVQDEQDANFITRLHAGKLQIIPWPVIESREFYKHFSAVKRKLDQQRSSHRTAGEFLHTLKGLMAKLRANDWGAMSQTMADHRASTLLAILPVALQTGYSEVSSELEPLKNFDTHILIEAEDTNARFLLAEPDTPAADREYHLSTLVKSWQRWGFRRQQVDDSEWISGLGEHLTHLVNLRVSHVDMWLKSNTRRFQIENASMEELRRTFNTAMIDLRASAQLCKSQCTGCNLLCIQSRSHEGDHDCLTTHKCIHDCIICDKPLLAENICSQIAGHKGDHVCMAHLCGKRCGLSGKHGCADKCAKRFLHEGDHVCSAPVHMCGQPCDLVNLKLLDGKLFTCPGICRVPINEEHTVHACEHRLCPISCQLCKRLCSGDHLHGLYRGENHLCGETHSCITLCSAAGICQINITPQSVEATSGRHGTFEYTKYTQTAKRLPCVKTIEPGKIEHEGPHVHTNERQPFHFCESRCEGCGHFCTLPLGHAQQEHKTSHGSMSQARWAIEILEGNGVESDVFKFSLNDDGFPMLCNLVCTSIGRHMHIDYCRGDYHDNPEVIHIDERMDPKPDPAKDWITHSLYWRRSATRDAQVMRPRMHFPSLNLNYQGPEHTVEVGGANVQPSYCTLPMFHPPMDAASAPSGLGYVSNDGHHFQCRNPIVLQHAFHMCAIFSISGSMSLQDRQPLPNSAGTERIASKANDRLGAVLSALYSFWIQRQAAVDRNKLLGGSRRDAYSLIFFNHEPSTAIENDSTSSPDELLTAALKFSASGGRNFSSALVRAQRVMTSHWSTERTPVVIFLSDGEDNVKAKSMYDLCRGAVRRGRPLSFHAVSFGKDSTSISLRRMAQIALEVQYNAPHDPLLPAAAKVPSSYTVALDTVHLAEPVLQSAPSMRKPRSFLLPSRRNGL